MPSLVFVRDVRGMPLMPIAPAYARKLLTQGKAQRVPHHAFTIIQLNYTIANPSTGPIVLGMKLERRQTHLLGLSFGAARYRPLLYIQIDPSALVPPGQLLPTTTLSPSIAGQTVSAIRFLASLLPIQTFHLLKSSIYSGVLTRLIHNNQRFGLLQVQQQRWQENLSVVTQLLAFLEQPSIALGSFVMVPKHIDLRQPRQQPSIRRVLARVAATDGSDTLGLSSTTAIRMPYWSSEQVRWSMSPLSGRRSYQTITGEPFFFLPIQMMPEKEDIDD